MHCGMWSKESTALRPPSAGQDVVERASVAVGDVDAGSGQVGGEGIDGGQVPEDVEQEAGEGEKDQKKKDGFLPGEGREGFH